MGEPDVLDLAERLWRGEGDLSAHHPVGGVTGAAAEVADGVAFVPSLANIAAFATGEGLVLVDTGGPFVARAAHARLREWSRERVHTAVYSHGHIDHVLGAPLLDEEAASAGLPGPRIVAHRAVPERFERYVLTAGYNAWINRRQFRIPSLEWPTSYRAPDETYDGTLVLEVGGERFELHHARGETDDHTWTWVPGRRVLCPGDLFIWASPNAGNPQKVQRYPREWAEALRAMEGLGAEVMLPGHGVPVIGAGRVRRALGDTAELLESLVAQALALMNEGARLDDLLGEVRPPAHLVDRPYLRPVYDDPEFVVRTVWRRYGGWWDGNPATLKPAREAAVAAEVAGLAGGARALATRARSLAAEGDLRLAGHLAEWAAQAAPDDPECHAARAEVLAARTAAEPSTMAKGIFGWAADESRARVAD